MEAELFEHSVQLQRESGEVLNGREMAEAFTCWGCIICRHKLIRPWKSQVSDTIRRRLIKPISHLGGLALHLSLSLSVPSFRPLISFVLCLHSNCAAHYSTLLCERFFFSSNSLPLNLYIFSITSSLREISRAIGVPDKWTDKI